jgi:hypothetical protein
MMMTPALLMIPRLVLVGWQDVVVMVGRVMLSVVLMAPWVRAGRVIIGDEAKSLRFRGIGGLKLEIVSISNLAC